MQILDSQAILRESRGGHTVVFSPHLSRALSEASLQMGEIGQRFLINCRNLLKGRMTAEAELRGCIGLALDGYGGIICAPLHYMKRFNPSPMDEGYLAAIRQGLDDFLEGVYSLCAICGIPRAFLRRFHIRHEALFTPSFFESHRPMFFHENLERLAVYRVRLIEHVCATFRAFLAWVRAVIGDAAWFVAHRAKELGLPPFVGGPNLEEETARGRRLSPSERDAQHSGQDAPFVSIRTLAVLAF